MYRFAKTHATVHLKSMHFVACQLNLDIADINILAELLHDLSACIGV